MLVVVEVIVFVFEIIDFCYKDFKFMLLEVIVDNVLLSGFVFGFWCDFCVDVLNFGFMLNIDGCVV